MFSPATPPQPPQTDQSESGITSANESITNEIRRAFNSHGFPFQEAVLRRIGENKSESGWEVWLPEFPVSVQDQTTRIDMILRNEFKNKYIVCECKRANPAIANWCFAKSQQRVKGSWSDNRVYGEALLDQGGGVIGMHIKELQGGVDIYHIAVEAKTNKKGETNSTGKGQIEEAAGQVCRGLNGLFEFFHKRQALKKESRTELLFVPMIITTAKLYVTDNDLSLASIESGELGSADLSVKEVPWLWYRYHQSPALKHQVPVNNPGLALEDALLYEFARSIAVVTPEGLSGFLKHRFWTAPNQWV